MRSITNCPACQTQFFVTDEQLSKYKGKVRCGHCLHVFDAKAQFVEEAPANEAPAPELPAETPQPLPEDNIAAQPEPVAVIDEPLLGDYTPSNFDDLADKSKLQGYKKKPRTWLWLFFAFVLLLIGLAQTAFFLRSEIAIYYPALKPYLVQACEKLACKVDLPKKIEFIVIDDSDIQEDADYQGLMHLTSTLINQANFNQAFPNLELTLTDTDDKPKLRRIFKPSDYLPQGANLEGGIGAGEEIKINLAMTTQGEPVAGYRVYVTY